MTGDGGLYFKATETKVDPSKQFNTATATKSSILWAPDERGLAMTAWMRQQSQPSMQFACLFMSPKAPQLGDHVGRPRCERQ